MANNWEVSLTPDAFVPDATAHPDRGVVEDRIYLAFDADTPETCYCKAFRVPTAHTGTGTLKVDVCYSMATATSGTVEFEAACESITDGDHDLDAGSNFDTASAGTETVPGTAGNSSTITISPSSDSAAAGDYFRLSLARDADDGTNDTATGDARVWWVSVYEEA